MRRVRQQSDSLSLARHRLARMRLISSGCLFGPRSAPAMVLAIPHAFIRTLARGMIGQVQVIHVALVVEGFPSRGLHFSRVGSHRDQTVSMKIPLAPIPFVKALLASKSLTSCAPDIFRCFIPIHGNKLGPVAPAKHAWARGHHDYEPNLHLILRPDESSSNAVLR